MSEDKKPKFDEGTDKRIHEHLSDENDEISEDDIRNVRTDIGSEDDAEEEKILAGEVIDEDDVDTTDNRDPDVDSDSWEILES